MKGAELAKIISGVFELAIEIVKTQSDGFQILDDTGKIFSMYQNDQIFKSKIDDAISAIPKLSEDVKELDITTVVGMLITLSPQVQRLITAVQAISTDNSKPKVALASGSPQPC